MITVYLIEDRPEVREGLRMWLSLAPDLALVGEAGNAAEAIAAVPRADPDVVVIDLRLPALDGLSTIAALRARARRAAVVAISLHDNPDLAARALAAGASAFVAKHEPNEALLDAIRRAAL